MFKRILIAVLLLGWCFASYLLLEALTEDYNNYKTESKCVKALIASGNERIRIITANGTCSLRKQYEN